MLPLFAVLLFALLPLMALVIHTGLVTLTRRQMQTAVNTAAIEGLRFRDDVPAAWLDEATAPPGLHNLESCGPPDSPPTPEWCDCARRYAASRLVALVFDDDLDPADDAMQFGAGPQIDLLDGTPLDETDFRAGTRISLPAERTYKPRLQLNLSNASYGDMVAGSYDATDTLHREWSTGVDYERTDFDPTAGDDAFLVRLRRTDNLHGLDDIPGGSHRGPPIPFLFGRGPYGGEEWLNRRERGTIVRASAIARATSQSPVSIAGPIIPDWLSVDGQSLRAVPGVSPIVLDRDDVTGIPTTENDPSDGIEPDDGRDVGPELTSTPHLLWRITTLSSPISASDSTITVSSSSGFPAPPFLARLDHWFGINTGVSEVIQVTAVNGTAWSVERGAWGTDVQSFPAGAPVILQRQITIGDIVPITDLAASLSEDDTVMTVTSSAGFAVEIERDGEFRVRIVEMGVVESVRVVVQNPMNPTQWTITRAQDGTNASSFSTNARVILRPASSEAPIDVTQDYGVGDGHTPGKTLYFPVYQRLNDDTFRVVAFRRARPRWRNDQTPEKLELIRLPPEEHFLTGSVSASTVTTLNVGEAVPNELLHSVITVVTSGEVQFRRIETISGPEVTVDVAWDSLPLAGDAYWIGSSVATENTSARIPLPFDEELIRANRTTPLVIVAPTIGRAID